MKDGNVFETMQEFYQAMADGEVIEIKKPLNANWWTTTLGDRPLPAIRALVFTGQLRIKSKEMTDAEKLQYVVDKYLKPLGRRIYLPDGSSVYATKKPKTKPLAIMVYRSMNPARGYKAKIKDNYGADYDWTGWQEHEIEWREE